MIRSSDFQQRETELDRGFDDTAQRDVERGDDWRKPLYCDRRRQDWSRVKRCGEAA